MEHLQQSHPLHILLRHQSVPLIPNTVLPQLFLQQQYNIYMRDEVSDLEEVQLHLGGVVQSAKNCAVADASFKELHAQVFQAVHVELHTDTEQVVFTW